MMFNLIQRVGFGRINTAKRSNNSDLQDCWPMILISLAAYCGSVA